MSSSNEKRQRRKEGSTGGAPPGGGDNFTSSSSSSSFGVSSNNTTSPFGASGMDNNNPFGATTTSPFGASGMDNNNPFGTSTNDNNSSPFGVSGNNNPFGATRSSDNDNPFGATANGSGDSNPFGATAGFGMGSQEATDPFAMSSGFTSDDQGRVPSPFGGATSPFGAAAAAPAEEALPPPSHVVPNPFGGMSLGQPQQQPSSLFGGAQEEEPPSHVVPNPFGGMSFGHQQEEEEQAVATGPAHVVPNPFGGGFGGAAAAPAADDPFAIGNDAGAAVPGHVIANPFGSAAAAAPQDPFAFGGGRDEYGAGHVVPNPFGAAPPQEDPFAFGGNNEDPAAPPAAGFLAGFGAAVANLNPFGGANPFGIANGGPFAADDDAAGGHDHNNDAELDLSQHSLGETFLAGHMNRIAQERSMTLTQDEQRWTKELRDAVNASADITPKLCDMEIAHQAIANEGHVLNALLSIKAIQEFRRTYQIDDTPQQGLECLRALFDQQDGMFLEIESNPSTHETSLVVDVREYDPSKALRIVEGKPANYSWSVLMRGYYYLHRVLTPSLASVRHGVFLIVDCDGVGWNNFNQEVENQVHAELIRHLPLNYKRTMAYGTAMVTSVWWGLTKRLWKEQFQNVLETGCRLVDTDPSRPPRRIADMYRQPNLATVTRRLERQIVDLLNTRETNEEEFSLASQQEQRRRGQAAAAAAAVSAR